MGRVDSWPHVSTHLVFLEVLHESAADAVHHALGRPRRPARVHDEQRMRKRNLGENIEFALVILFVSSPCRILQVVRSNLIRTFDY